jgi:hypothetical protein
MRNRASIETPPKELQDDIAPLPVDPGTRDASLSRLGQCTAGRAPIFPDQTDPPAQTSDERTSPDAYLDIADLGSARFDGAVAKMDARSCNEAAPGPATNAISLTGR